MIGTTEGASVEPGRQLMERRGEVVITWGRIMEMLRDSLPGQRRTN
jgi:hypothetical protein